MTMRWASRRDSTQADIVKALRDKGYVVEIVQKPVDLAIRRPWWPAGIFLYAECKTRTTKAGFYKDKRQKKQAEFCLANAVPYWMSEADATDTLERYDRLFEAIGRFNR